MHAMNLMRVASFLTVCSVAVIQSADPCLEYSSVNQPERSVKAAANPDDILLCDNEFDEDEWQRFTAPTGGLIPERSRMEYYRCGTNIPVFLLQSGGTSVHPQTDNKEVTATVCASNATYEGCMWTSKIRIRRCPAGPDDDAPFYVYKLKHVGGCPMAYCAGETEFLCNVARGKRAAQSSTLADARGPAAASRAVDGNKSPNWNDATCSLTDRQVNPWWMVDLQTSVNVIAVNITNRGDCCEGRLQDARVSTTPPTPSSGVTPSRSEGALHDVRVSLTDDDPSTTPPTPSSGVTCATQTGPVAAGEVLQLTCTPPGVRGRYVVVQIQSAAMAALSLCEVEVFESCLPTNEHPVIAGPPVLSDPIIVPGGENQKYDTFKFECKVQYNGTDNQARFRVRFLFDGVELKDCKYCTTLEPIVTTPADLTVSLPEDYLRGRLGKNISCDVESFWKNSPKHRSSKIESVKKYWAGIRSTLPVVTLDLNKDTSQAFEFTSTVPITFAYCNACRRTCDDPNYRFSYAFKVASSTSGGMDKSTCGFGMNQTGTAKMTVVSSMQLLQSTERQYQVNFSRFDTDFSCRPAMSIWQGYQIPPVKVRVLQPTATSNMLSCDSVGDPHIKKIDGSWIHPQTEGDFYLVYAKNEKAYLHLEVQVRHEKCGHSVTCNCGVIVREGNSIIGVHTCGSHTTPVVARYLEQFPSDGSTISSNSAGNHYTIWMPSGLRVEVHRWWKFMNIYVLIPQLYANQLSGLCTARQQGPSQSRVPENDSFFNKNADIECMSVRNNEPMSCDCSAMKDPKTQRRVQTAVNCSQSIDPSMAKRQVTHVRRTGKVCDVSTEPVIPPMRRRRSAVDSNSESAEDSDVTDLGELYPDEQKIDAGQPEEPVQKITDDEARKYCTDALKRSAAYSACKSKILTSAKEKELVDACLFDVKSTGDPRIADQYTSQMETQCLIETVMDAKVTEDSNVLPSEVTAVMKDLCTGHCNKQHGTCVDGKCVCGTGYIGDDCSTHKGTPPVINGLVRGGLCDVSHYSCETATVFVQQIVHSPELTCRYTRRGQGQAASSEGDTWTTHDTAGSMTSSSELTCPLPSRSFRPALVHLTLAVSLDGVHFSQSRDMTVFDPVCMLCNNTSTTSCTFKSDTCLIANRCYKNGDRDEQNCRHCDPTRSTQWSGKSCGNGADILTSTSVFSLVVRVVVGIWIAFNIM